MPNQEISSKLAKYQLTLTNANDPAILQATTTYNFGSEKLLEGSNLLSTAQQLSIQQDKEYGEQYSSTQKLKQAIEAFKNTMYIPHLKLARKLFPNDPGIRSSLCLDGSRKENYDDWSSEARLFYANALSTATVADRFELVNITPLILQTGLEHLDNIERLRAAQRKESGEAQQATDDRDKAIDAISEWMSLYYTVAEIALANKPQLLEKLGVKA